LSLFTLSTDEPKSLNKLLHFTEFSFIAATDNQLHLRNNAYPQIRCLFHVVQTADCLFNLQSGINKDICMAVP
jgi:hypothetical protein